jgi:type IV pilus assembly protein PilC
MIYEYKARDNDGNVHTGTLRAEQRYSALAELKARGFTVVSLEPQNATAARKSNSQKAAHSCTENCGRRRLFAPRVKAGEMAIFCRQLAISVTAGVSLRDALEAIVDDVESAPFREVLKKVVADLHDGSSFSDAIAQHRSIFDELFVALIRAAEESGSMASTLTHISDSLERRERLIRKIRGITAYPIFIGVFFLLICGVMTLFVLPKFEKAMAGIGGTLPPLTRIVFGANRFIIDNLPAIIAGCVALVIAFTLFRRTDSGRIYLDRLKLKFPLFGACIKKIAIARFCQNLAIMVNGGVSITQAMEIAADICGNIILRAALLDARDRIIAGSNIASSLTKGGVFPGFVIRMVSVGEASGQLPEVLEQVSSSYEDQVEGEIVLVTSMLEPILICVFGGFILILVLAIYLPVFTMSRGVKG